MMRRHWLRFIVMFALSGVAGAATITLALARHAAEDFTLPDLLPMYVLLLVFGLPLAAVALPALLLLRRQFTSLRSALLYPLVSVLLIAAPVAVATGLPALVRATLPVGEALLFTGAFAVLGLTFGLTFLRLYGAGWMRHWMTTLACVLLTVGAVAATTSVIPRATETLLASRANGSVARALTMAEPRSAHTATLMPDGRVWLAGGMISVRGQEVATTSTEIYDPRANTLTPGVKLHRARAGHTATLLADGNILLTGGGAEQETLTGAELYRPVLGDVILVGAMRVPRERHAAALLPDGRVLITGGTVAQPSATADLYDPQTATFSAAPPMHARRAAHSATLLKDGRVLIAGGAESLESVLRSVEIYDPAANSFAAAGQMQASRYKHSAALLANGRVMLLGGADERDWDGRRQSVEIYNPASGRSQLIAPLHRARFKFPQAVAVTASGVVVVGGSGRRVEVFDEARNQFSVSGGSLDDEWFYATATALSDGRVFIAGGYNDALSPTSQVWLYQPPATQPAQVAVNARRND